MTSKPCADSQLELARRSDLHRLIGALEGKLKKLGDPLTPLDRDRFWRLYGKKHRLERELVQPRLL